MATLNLKNYFQLMTEYNASDLYITAGAPAAIKVNGLLRSINSEVLTAPEARDVILQTMSPTQQQTFLRELEMNLGIEEPGCGSFRVNVYQQRGQLAMVVRRIPSKIPTMEELGLPEIFKKIIMARRGLILITGATGTGKSTTMASMIDYRNRNSGGHIISVEDPIEFLHQHHKSIISQREIGIDTHSYENALQSIVREAPDLVYIGEIRSREVMLKAIQLAETGHLCISSLHANNSPQAIERIINLFPNDWHAQILSDLSLNLRAIISQRLVPALDGKRVASFEIMTNSPRISDIIRTGDLHEIRDLLVREDIEGIQSFDTDLYKLFKTGKISKEEALRNASSEHNLSVKIALDKGADFSSEHKFSMDAIKKPKL